MIKFVIAFGQKIVALHPACDGTKDWLVWKLLENSSAEARGEAPSEAGNQNFTTWLARIYINASFIVCFSICFYKTNLKIRAMIKIKMKVKMFLTIVNFFPNNFISRGRVVIPIKIAVITKPNKEP